jgi:uncharacterized membrane protein
MMSAMKPLKSVKRSLAGLLIALSCLIAVMAAPTRALAAQNDEITIDARAENYPRAVKVEEGSTALTWMLFVLLAAICLSVLFKNAKRSHLD